MKRVVLSGPPHSGKSTLIRGLKNQFPHMHTVPEPAGVIIDKHAGSSDSFWTSVSKSPCAFSELCLEQAIAHESAIPADAQFILMDRCVIDTIAYMKRDGCPKALIDRGNQLAKTTMVHTVLLCEPVGDYGNRPETPEEAQKIAQLLNAAYGEYGIPRITIPAIDEVARLSLVTDHLEEELGL